MTTSVTLPDQLEFFGPQTFAVISAPYPQVRALMLDIWGRDSEQGWIWVRDIPCAAPVSDFEMYQGGCQFGMFAGSKTHKDSTCLWSSEADCASPSLVKLATRLSCKVVSTTFCEDWGKKDAIAELHAFNVNVADSERIVRVMRNDTGRFEFLQQGDPLSFENPRNYERRLLKHRLGNDVLEGYWQTLRVDIKAERRDWALRPGLAYVYAVSRPIRRST